MLAKKFFLFVFGFLVGFLSAAKIYFLFFFLYLIIFEKRIFWLLFASIFVLLGYLYGQQILAQTPKEPFLVSDYPQDFGTFQRVTLKDRVGNLFFAFLSKNNAAQVGDLLTFKGEFKQAKRTYFFPKVKVIGTKNILLRRIASLREKLEDRVKKYLPFPEENLLRGLIFGSELQEPNFRKEFQRSGLSHLTAVSGYNLTLITSLTAQFLTYFTFLTPNLVFLITILVMFFFLLLMGLKATVVRAVILGFIVLLLQKIGRPPLKINLLLLVFLIFLFWQPELVLFDIAFHLSFLSLFAIFYVANLLPMNWPQFLRETISAQLVVFPYLLSFSGFFNPLAILANALVLPIIPFLMIIGLISVILPFVSLLTYPFLWYLIFVSKIFSQASIFLPLPQWFIFFIYFLCGFLFLIKRRDEELDLAFLSH